MRGSLSARQTPDIASIMPSRCYIKIITKIVTPLVVGDLPESTIDTHYDILLMEVQLSILGHPG